MTPTLSPRALLREAYALRRAEDPTLNQYTLAEKAGMPQPRIVEALTPDRPCQICNPGGYAKCTDCGACDGSGRVPAGEPTAKTVERILRALGFGMTLVDVRET